MLVLKSCIFRAAAAKVRLARYTCTKRSQVKSTENTTDIKTISCDSRNKRLKTNAVFVEPPVGLESDSIARANFEVPCYVVFLNFSFEVGL